jgi:hypothetical protein
VCSPLSHIAWIPTLAIPWPQQQFPNEPCAVRGASGSRERERERYLNDVRRRHGRAWSSGGDKEAGGGCGGRRRRCRGGPLPHRGWEIRQTRYVLVLCYFSSVRIRPAWPPSKQDQIDLVLDRRALLGSLLLRCVPFHQRHGLACGLQPRRWWPSRRRCMIPATCSGTGTSSSATIRANGAWSPAKRDKFKSCMFSSLILCCAYIDVYFCFLP